MARFDGQGVGIARVLADAGTAGAGVDDAVAALTNQGAVVPCLRSPYDSASRRSRPRS
ncbi:hypothetical protein [Streptomyces sp. SID1121]|uniref:hypothetical protein n=1 Tax=Streptomyces sp. SID1121 TaxID=3425888 RepID=UPI004056BDC6